MIKLFGIVGLFLLCASCSTNELVVGNTNECINVPWHGYPINGTQVRLLQCYDNPQQQWYFQNGAITGIGGLCLDVLGGQPENGAHIIAVQCNGAPSQQWTYANGQIVGIGGKCIDVANGALFDRVPLIIAPCAPSPSQQWSMH